MERISQYLENKQFIDWIFNPTPELEAIWQNFQISHPNEKGNLALARKVLRKFNTIDKQLSGQEKIVLFTKILSEIEKNQSSKIQYRSLFVFAKYAAVALIFFTIGSLLFYQRNFVNPHFFIQNSVENTTDRHTTLVRPNGESIMIDENKSVISYQSDGKNLIINDSIRLKKSVATDENVFNQLSVPYGKTSVILLTDGSKVTLNAGSRLVYPENFLGDKREVFLSGEAFFEIQKDSKHPFIVATSDINVEVKGTKFNLSAYASDPNYETVLTEGKVRIRQNQAGLFEQAIDLEPNQMASFSRQLRKTEISIVNVDEYTLWKDGMFKFESSELSSVVRKLERYYNVSFLFQKQSLRNLKISGKLELDENKDVVFEILASSASIKINKNNNNEYYISE